MAASRGAVQKLNWLLDRVLYIRRLYSYCVERYHSGIASYGIVGPAPAAGPECSARNSLKISVHRIPYI